MQPSLSNGRYFISIAGGQGLRSVVKAQTAVRNGSQWRVGYRTFSIVLVLAFSFLNSSGLDPVTAQELIGIGQYFERAIEMSQPKMVKVFGASVGNVEGTATGILVSREGHVLTMQGVFLDGRKIRVILADGAEYSATVLKRDRQTQLALLKIEAETPYFFELSSAAVGDQGDWVVALTNAFRVADKDEPVSVMWGIISLRTTMEARLTRRDVAYNGELVLVDCITSNPGAGGGAVVLADGRLVGMVGRIIDSSETNTRLNYAVPNSILKHFLRNEAEQEVAAGTTGLAQKAELGIQLFKLGGRNNPAYIEQVKPGSPAFSAGLQPDDLIISIGGQRIGNIKQYDEFVDSLNPGEEVILIVKRGTEFLRFPLKPETRK
jgi:serine protease Do